MDFEILLKERWTFLNPQGNPVEGYRITFRMADGTTDYIKITEDQLDPEIVGKKIEEKVIRHNAIDELGM